MMAGRGRILLANHTARMSGAELGMLELLRALPDPDSAAVGCPAGPLESRVRALGVPAFRLRGTDAGLKLHPVRTPHAVGALAADAVTLLREARRRESAVMYANSTRAALSCGLARRLGGPPLVVHVHDVVGDGPVSALVGGVIARTADVVLANSEHVRASIERRGTVPVTVVPGAVDLSRFDPARGDGARVRRELGIAADEPVLAVVAQITPWKGQDVAIRALAALPDRHRSARLLVVGAPVFATQGTRYDNAAWLGELRGLASRLGVAGRVAFLGAREDVPDVLAATDIALVPSWEEPFGRVVVEAMAMSVPVLATAVGGPAEVLAGGGGLVLPPRDVERWTAAIARLLDDPAARRRTGAQARTRAEGYGVDRFTNRVLAECERAASAARLRRASGAA